MYGSSTLPWKSLKSKIFPFFKALKSYWKRIWCLKVMEFSLRGLWKCWNAKIVVSLCEKWCSHQRTMRNIVNISVTDWLDACVICWILRWSRFGNKKAVLSQGNSIATSLRVASSQASKAMPQSSKHTSAKQNLMQNGHSRLFKVMCFGVSERQSGTK